MVLFRILLICLLTLCWTSLVDGDLKVTAYRAWAQSRAEVLGHGRDDCLQMLAPGESTVCTSGVVRQTPLGITAFAYASAEAAIEFNNNRALLFSGSTITENLYLPSFLLPHMYSEAGVFLEMEFEVESPGTTLEFLSFNGPEYAQFEFRNLDSGADVPQGFDVVLVPGRYRMTIRQFEFRDGSHGNSQSADPYSLVLLDSDAIQFDVNSAMVAPEHAVFSRGEAIQSGLGDLASSDDFDLSVFSSNRSIESIAEIQLTGVSPVPNPAAMEFSLESSAAVRSPVIQTIEIRNFQTGAFELMDVRNATLTDTIVTVDPGGGYQDYVDPGSGEVQVRITFASLNPRQQVKAYMDHAFWRIDW